MKLKAKKSNAKGTKSFEVEHWFDALDWESFAFQRECWQAYLAGKHGLLNAPTGSGKTYAVMLGILEEYIRDPALFRKSGIRILWVTPIRALAEEIRLSAERACEALDIPWQVAIRTGDTTTAERGKQMKSLPQILITTPESIHLMLAQKDYPARFSELRALVVDEWHELMGSKRGVQMELAISRFKSISRDLRIWGISATIGNLEEAAEVLLGNDIAADDRVMIRADIHKPLEVISILPDEVEIMPWSGHLGVKLMEKLLPIIHQSKSCLIFTNTRSQAEIWYQKLLDADPDLAGIIALHHSSISKDLRQWVENALHDGTLKAVVCTSSLDLGVDFRPVDTIIQIGGPKGVARFVQRAGRSGHQPGALSRIYFLPTHSLELIEAAALREAIKQEKVESRIPYIRSFDVLAQYLVTLAVSEGFTKEQIRKEILSTHCYESIHEDEFNWVLAYICSGGDTLQLYDEFHKVVFRDGVYRVESRKIAMRHRLSIGTIVSDNMLQVNMLRGGYLGMIEERFITQLKPGSIFWFAGRFLEFVQIKDMKAVVRKTEKRSGLIPAWLGGRLPLSAQLGEVLRNKLYEAFQPDPEDPELKFIQPLIAMQAKRSAIPSPNELLIEQFESKDGFHLYVYPFEGRFVHEAMSSLLAYRMARIVPKSFSMASNDYGFEMLSDKKFEVNEKNLREWLSPENLFEDLRSAINSFQMASAKFRDIAVISGLVFQGYPSKAVKERHLKSSTQLLFKVLVENDPKNLLLRQAFDEAMSFQVEEGRLLQCMQRISGHRIILKELKEPSPLAFPIWVDRLRQQMSNESLEDRVKKMQLDFG